MGQKFVPELHDPNYRKSERLAGEPPTEDETDELFDAIVAKLDAEDRAERCESQNSMRIR